MNEPEHFRAHTLHLINLLQSTYGLSYRSQHAAPRGFHGLPGSVELQPMQCRRAVIESEVRYYTVDSQYDKTMMHVPSRSSMSITMNFDEAVDAMFWPDLMVVYVASDSRLITFRGMPKYEQDFDRPRWKPPDSTRSDLGIITGDNLNMKIHDFEESSISGSIRKILESDQEILGRMMCERVLKTAERKTSWK